MPKNGIDRLLLVGFTVPKSIIEEICLSDRYMPIQTNKLAWSIVRGLENNGLTVDLLSSYPVSLYPFNPRILFGLKKWSRNSSTWNMFVPFINMFIIRHLTRFFACAVSLGLWLLVTDKKGNRIVLVHGVHSAFLYAVLMARYMFKFKYLVLATDPPAVELQEDGPIIRRLKRIDKYAITAALRLCDGIISVTPQLAKNYAPRVPNVIVEGILSMDDTLAANHAISKAHELDESHFVIFYAGGLKVEYGVDMLLRAFAYIKKPRFKLWIFGKGELEKRVRDAANEDPRIRFMGYRPQNEIRYWAHRATVLVNPRPSNQDFAKYSFPSKIIEYMSFGRPVISTKLPGIPEEYFSYLISLSLETPEELANIFTKLSSFSRKDLEGIGSKAREFVFSKKNEDYQGKRICEFIQSVEKKGLFNKL